MTTLGGTRITHLSDPYPPAAAEERPERRPDKRNMSDKA